MACTSEAEAQEAYGTRNTGHGARELQVRKSLSAIVNLQSSVFKFSLASRLSPLASSLLLLASRSVCDPLSVIRYLISDIWCLVSARPSVRVHLRARAWTHVSNLALRTRTFLSRLPTRLCVYAPTSVVLEHSNTRIHVSDVASGD